MKRKIAMAAVACGLGVAMVPAASAQVSDRWQFGASLYGWFPSISGETTFPPQGGSTNVSVNADDIVANLNFVFMGSFEARKGRWGAFTDVIYMDVGDTKSQTREFSLGGAGLPADVSGNLHYDLKSWVWTLAGEYRVVADPGTTMDAFVGARYVDVKQSIDYELGGNVASIPILDRSGNRSLKVSNLDGIVGVKGRLSFGDQRRWFVPWYLDVGAGDSDLTWQAMGGVGYSFAWGEIVAAWRYLDYQLGGQVDSLTLSGPAVAVNFRW